MKNELTKKRDYYRTLPYGIVLRRDEQGDWVARVSELPGCTAHGSTQAEALKNVEEVMAAWIEDALVSGAVVPEPRNDERLPSGKWLQRVPRSLHKKLVEMAEREDVSLNQLVTSLLSEAVGGRSGRALADNPAFQKRQREDVMVVPARKRAISFKNV